MLGILAYGSLIDCPGEEINEIIASRVNDIETPFAVEFARSSNSRDGAPTLIPFKKGAKVLATILVLEKHVTITEAKNKLWRRETGKKGTYNRPFNPSINSVIVEELRDFNGLDSVFYTRIGNNIDFVTPKILAQLAIKSVKSQAGTKERDGITYLISAKNNGIETPLSAKYEYHILNITGKETLEEARDYLLSESDV